MTPKKTLEGTAAAPLVHWLLLVSGLALVTVQRGDRLETVLPLWLGGVVGTALGQLMGYRRMRLWLVLGVLVNLMWIIPLATLPLWGWFQDLHDIWGSVEAAGMAFAPAVICGYLSLGERAALAVFWFPAVLWMMAILDQSGSTQLHGSVSWLLLAGSSALLLVSLYTREARRIALWRGYATVRLAAPRSGAVLREAPLRRAGQVAWVAALGTLSLAITAWIAPLLWQTEDAGTSTTAGATAATEPGAADGTEACCPDGTGVEVRRHRVREYFPLLNGHDGDREPALPTHCIACRDGVPIGSASWKGAASGPATGTDVAPADPAYVGGPGGFAPQVDANGHVPPGGNDTVQPPGTPLHPTPALAPREPGAAAVAVAPAQIRHGGAAGHGVARRRARPAVETREADPLPWLLTLAITALALHLGLRPLRRWLLVRHLHHPFWAETVDQRVSNLWQLVLVGLRDAGWHAAPGEQPQELARRIGLEGMKTCATVLERARHGVRVDREDLEAMSGAALSVYASARQRAGGVARASAWMRWPLV